MNLIKESLYSTLSVVSPLPLSSQASERVVIAKGDSAASDHYVRSVDKHCLSNIKPTIKTPITIPDGTTISASHTGTLPLDPLISKVARTAKILPSLQSATLLSLGKLCDDGCNVSMDSQKLTLTKNNKIVMQGTRNHHDQLWDIPIQKKTVVPDNYALPTIHPQLYFSPNITTNKTPTTR